MNISELAKQVIELAEKHRNFRNLWRSAEKSLMVNARRYPTKTVIDDAFDAMEIIVKNIGCTPDDVSKVQKLVFRELVYRMILNQNVYIRK